MAQEASDLFSMVIKVLDQDAIARERWDMLLDGVGLPVPALVELFKDKEL